MPILCSLNSFFTVLWIRRMEFVFLGIYASMLNLTVFLRSSILSGGTRRMRPVVGSVFLISRVSSSTDSNCSLASGTPIIATLQELFSASFLKWDRKSCLVWKETTTYLEVSENLFF